MDFADVWLEANRTLNRPICEFTTRGSVIVPAPIECELEPAEHTISEHESRIALHRLREKMHGLQKALLLGFLEFESFGLQVECVGGKIGGRWLRNCHFFAGRNLSLELVGNRLSDFSL